MVSAGPADGSHEISVLGVLRKLGVQRGRNLRINFSDPAAPDTRRQRRTSEWDIVKKGHRQCGALSHYMRTPGVEPGPLAGQDPKSCASASSATFANGLEYTGSTGGALQGEGVAGLVRGY